VRGLDRLLLILVKEYLWTLTTCQPLKKQWLTGGCVLR